MFATLQRSLSLGRRDSSSSNGPATDNGKNVGILAIEVYTPRTYVTQSSLEAHSGVSPGRYTLGLGQDALAVTGDAEDVNSLSLTVVHSLLEKYSIEPADVGRLEVGTETLVDKSKSTKTVLMDLFGDNTDVEGATVVNACYGGTAALLNAFAWVESDGWDGRYAIVVAADIAAYARGPARPTCGAGAVAVLVGRDAPLAFDPRERATHAANVYDFYKPDHTVEYPTVDGALSQVCYYRALEDCYGRFADKIDRLGGFAAGDDDGVEAKGRFDADSADYFVFHAPYNKLVQKSYGRLHLLDARRRHAREQARKARNDEEKKDSNDDEVTAAASDEQDSAIPVEFLTKPIEETYSDKSLEKTLKSVSKASYDRRLSDSNAASKVVGNTYTASVFLGLASLIDGAGSRGELTDGTTAVVFSYGSGAIATMYRLRVRTPAGDVAGRRVFTVGEMAKKLDLTARLASRELVGPEELDLALETRARMHRSGAPYSPVYPTLGRMFPGTYYLAGIDSKWVRTYARVPLDDIPDPPGSMLAPPIVLRLAERDAHSTPATGLLNVLVRSASGTALDQYDESRRRVACVITGTSAGLPCGDDADFGPDNLRRLVEGELQCIVPISGTAKAEMLDRNVVQLKKLGKGKTERYPVSTEGDVIKVAARLGCIDLPGGYGVPPGLAETMVSLCCRTEREKHALHVLSRSSFLTSFRSLLPYLPPGHRRAGCRGGRTRGPQVRRPRARPVGGPS